MTIEIDQRSLELAEHFMADVQGHSARHVRDLAEAIQQICEDHCSMAEADCSEERRTTEAVVPRGEGDHVTDPPTAIARWSDPARRRT